jgi:hypothetical protein
VAKQISHILLDKKLPTSHWEKSEALIELTLQTMAERVYAERHTIDLHRLCDIPRAARYDSRGALAEHRTTLVLKT